MKTGGMKTGDMKTGGKRRPAALVLASGLVAAGVIAGGLIAGGWVAASRLEAAAPRDVDWRRIATSQDRGRLRGWREAWMAARTMSEGAGAGAAMARDPVLLDPDVALPDAALPAGGYRCRTVKLGGRGPASLPLLAMGWGRCRVGHDGRATTFAIDGPMRVSGHLFDDTDARQVFLGTLAVGDETRPMRYGRDPRRDMAGLIERIGPKRWRLVLPYPAFASTLDVIEILPAG